MYLKNSGFLATPFAQIIDAAQAVGDDRYTVRVSHDVAEQFRSAFTDRLAKIGFDVNYDPTSEGRMLEELIDRFY